MKLLLFLTLALPGFAFAEIYKCIDAGGKVEFRSLPCPEDSNAEIITETKSNVAQAASPSKSEEKPFTFWFKSIPINQLFDLLAGFAERDLIIDPGVSWLVHEKYENVPWDIIANELASKHGLKIEITKKSIRVWR